MSIKKKFLAIARRLPFLKEPYFVVISLFRLPLDGACQYILYKLGLSVDRGKDIRIRVGKDAWVNLRRNGTDIKIFQQIFLLGDCKIPSAAFGKEPKIIIDGGAHIGCTSLYFSLRYPNARIISVEPGPDNFAQLSRNVANRSNVKPLHAAISGCHGWVTIANPHDDEWTFQVKPCLAGSASSIPAVTLDDLIRDHGEIDLLKLDIEGSELEVFQENTGWLDKVTAINIELHDHIKPGCSNAFEAAVSKYDGVKKYTTHNVIWSKG